MPFLLLKWITDLCSNKCFALHLSPGTRAAVLGYFTEAAKPRARGSTTVGPSEPMGNTLIRRYVPHHPLLGGIRTVQLCVIASL